MRFIYSTLLLILAICLGSSANASPLREGDEFWLINSRGISSSTGSANLENPNLRVYRYDPTSGTQNVPMDYLFDCARQRPDYVNVLYIHGNRFTSKEAIQRSWQIYQKIRYRQPEPIRIRWILWSWPSDKMLNPLKDVRCKAARADAQTLYVGWWLRRLPTLERLHLIGYSFGGRIATGSLHVAAGGAIRGRRVPGESITGARVDVSLIAPALDQNWLQRGANHGLAVDNMQTLNLFYNNRDRALRLYSMVSNKYDPVALGFAGIRALPPRCDGMPIDLKSKNCSNSVGLLHDELKYYEPCCGAEKTIANTIRQNNEQVQYAREVASRPPTLEMILSYAGTPYATDTITE